MIVANAALKQVAHQVLRPGCFGSQASGLGIARMLPDAIDGTQEDGRAHQPNDQDADPRSLSREPSRRNPPRTRQPLPLASGCLQVPGSSSPAGMPTAAEDEAAALVACLAPVLVGAAVSITSNAASHAGRSRFIVRLR
jgi:hypothetical protein